VNVKLFYRIVSYRSVLCDCGDCLVASQVALESDGVQRTSEKDAGRRRWDEAVSARGWQLRQGCWDWETDAAVRQRLTPLSHTSVDRSGQSGVSPGQMSASCCPEWIGVPRRSELPTERARPGLQYWSDQQASLGTPARWPIHSNHWSLPSMFFSRSRSVHLSSMFLCRLRKTRQHTQTRADYQ